LFPYYAALKKLQVSVVASLFAMSSLIVPVLSWFILGEKLHPLNYIGFFIVLASSFLISKGKGAVKLNKGFWYMAIACAMLAANLMIATQLLNEMDWVSVIFYNYIFTSALVLPWLLIRKVRGPIVNAWSKFKVNVKQFFILGGLEYMATATAVFSLSILPVVVSDGISKTQPLFVLMIGVLLKTFGSSLSGFKENINKKELFRKGALLTLMLAGVMLLTL
jgi:drug/metabolite transporter (DMT)-like permease